MTKRQEAACQECVLSLKLIKRLHVHVHISTPGVMLSLALCMANSGRVVE